MNRQIRWLAIAVGVLMLVFGILCINYTKMGNVERHARVAQERGWPPPSRGILYLGMLFAPLGGGLAGFAIGRGRTRARRQLSEPHDEPAIRVTSIIL